jgi:hypothetical protein
MQRASGLPARVRSHDVKIENVTGIAGYHAVAETWAGDVPMW